MQKRYSKYIRPIAFFIDILTIILLVVYFFDKRSNLNIYFLIFYLFTVWSCLSFITKIYEVYRFTSLSEIFNKTVKQIALFSLLLIAMFPFNKYAVFNVKTITCYILTLFVLIFLLKTILSHYLKKYRIITGNNFRNVIIIGQNERSNDLLNIFQKRVDFGYRFKGFISSDRKNPNVIGNFSDIENILSGEKIDEIYCSLSEVNNNQIKHLVYIADENEITLKFIPDTKTILSKNFKIDHYEVFPVFSLNKSPLDVSSIKILKRIFDVFFSVLVILFVLSWLVPILGILIKLESKGSIFFKQSRPGINQKEFICYKFRSMQINKTTEKEASRNDPRVTRIGKFIRKTSIDELPQFFNVLLGDMSIVGPRPHLWSQNKNYGKRIKKYMIRHHIKPGITGLAQVKGYRGEIETDEDMINRVRYDVFYIENWSIFLDVKIIILTVINIFRGEEKAY